jgi:hypothetical protein
LFRTFVKDALRLENRTKVESDELTSPQLQRRDERAQPAASTVAQRSVGGGGLLTRTISLLDEDERIWVVPPPGSMMTSM